GQNGAMLERGGDWASPCVAAATAEVAGIPAGIPPGIPPGVHPAEAPVEGTSAPREASRQPPRLAPSASVTTPAAPPQGAQPSAPAAASELAAQNALFADAMSSKARGDTRSALASLDFLLEKYPRTPLREAAEAQRMLVVSGSDRARAALLAKAYLARYPHGFARADAEKIAANSP
ncbi:MAG: hypothetical protein JWO86_456, partial [Myxococcaceae bacterium]|nr:hypothetical protein [Myxococcaceae bacterium]